MLRYRGRFVAIFLFWVSVPAVFAQFYNNGQDPAALKWYQINTDHYRILFPQGFKDRAQYVANLFEHSYSFVNYSLHSEPRKITVILHDQSVSSNGMVVWAPRRVELYPVTDPESYPDGALQ